MRPLGITLALLAVALAATPSRAQTPDPDEGRARPRPTQPVAVVGERVTTRYAFVQHAAFFSVETGQHALIDPQVFVADPRSAAGTGPQNIAHAQGFRPALMTDDPAASIANANGVPLAHDLGTWLQARGSVSLLPPSGGHRVRVTFINLIPVGKYSLFESRFAADGNVTFAPLDGRGTANNFSADPAGRATLDLTMPDDLTRTNGIVVVYHSDGQFHGRDRGVPGVSAHHQLVFRLP